MNRPSRWLLCAAVLASLGSLASQIACGQKPAAHKEQADAASSAVEPAAVTAVMDRACDWQLAHQPDSWTWRNGHVQPIESTSWIRSVFYIGVMAAWRTTGEARFLEAAETWAAANEWRLGPRPRHADDQCAGQVYLELYEVQPDPIRIAPLRAAFDAILADPQPGREEWSWCDALFMAPFAWAELSRVTGDGRYRDLMNTMWWDTTAFLYDEQEHLFYRDARFRPPPGGRGERHENGAKIFWSRGNGWVLAGTARVLEALPPDDPERGRYVELFTEMATRIVDLQAEDGLWRVSLLAPELFPFPETSGSALFCYALAWGLHRGLLDAARVRPAVDRAWAALVAHVDEQGRLGWVQPPGDLPRIVTARDAMEFGVGALLLAGSEMARLGDAR